MNNANRGLRAGDAMAGSVTVLLLDVFSIGSLELGTWCDRE
jgi:hypothetical protein